MLENYNGNIVVVSKGLSTFLNLFTLFIIGFTYSEYLADYVSFMAIAVVAVAVIDFGENTLNSKRGVSTGEWQPGITASRKQRIGILLFLLTALIVFGELFLNIFESLFAYFASIYATFLSNRIRTVNWREGYVVTSIVEGEIFPSLGRLFGIFVSLIFFQDFSIDIVVISWLVASVFSAIFSKAIVYKYVALPFRLDQKDLPRRSLGSFLVSYIASIALSVRDQAVSLLVVGADESKQVAMVVFSRTLTVVQVLLSGSINKIHILLDKDLTDRSKSQVYAFKLTFFIVLTVVLISTLLMVISQYYGNGDSWSVMDGLVAGASIIAVPLNLYFLATGKHLSLIWISVMIFACNVIWWL